MKKSDLKNGYVVDLRADGCRRVVLFDELLIDENGRYERASNLIEKYRDDLTHRSNPNLDIMKVCDEGMDLIWEREEIDWSKIPVGTKVLVSDDNKEWFEGFFVLKGSCFTVVQNKQSRKLSAWIYCKLAEDPKEEVSYNDVLKEFEEFCNGYFKIDRGCAGCEYNDGNGTCNKGGFINNKFAITRK